jgi:hypothetical protein
MTGEQHGWAQVPDPEAELGLLLGAPVTDAEIDRLCELAASGAADAGPGRPFAVNRAAGIRGLPPVTVEDPPGRWRLYPEISDFAGSVFARERSRRQAEHSRQALTEALADVPEPCFRVLRDLCAPPAPLESAVRGRRIDDPDGFVSAVNGAARSHGIDRPVVQASAWTVRATDPPDVLVSAVLRRLQALSEQRQRDALAGLVADLSPDEAALLRHLAGFGVADETDLRRLDPAGDLINERARGAGLFDPGSGLVLLRRDDRGRWRLHPATLARIRDLLSQAVR